jgi:hypothetical protein
MTTTTIIANATLQVFTVAQIEKPGFEPVTVGTRATKDAETGEKRVIPANARTRSILIPTLTIVDVPSKYQMFLLDGIRNTAKAQLSAMWKADANLREVPANVWTVDALLMYAAREAESKRLSIASITEWFESSNLCAAIMKKGNTKLLKDWTARIVGMAATVFDYNEQDCQTILNMLAKFEDDAESLVGQQLVHKLNKRIATLRKQLDEISLEEFDIEDGEDEAQKTLREEAEYHAAASE